ncbi:MAG: lysine 2,3-aminomutase [Myxococcota bacterium]
MRASALNNLAKAPEFADWRWQVANTLSSAAELAEYLKLTDSELGALQNPDLKFKAKITPHYLSLMNPEDSDDPLRKMVIPRSEEFTAQPHDLSDPLAEEEFSPVKNLVRRYPDRAVLISSNICPVNCRFCTRRRIFAEERGAIGEGELEETLAFLQRTPEICELIISGGEFLLFSDRRIGEVLSRVRKNPHIGVIRIGARSLAALPQRFTPKLVKILAAFSPLFVQSHINHPAEFSEESAEAIAALVDAGIPVNNQTVLLKGVNDDAETLVRLNRLLLEHRVRPYYLFHCDQTVGNSHFRTSITEGVEIIKAMEGRVSGLIIPHYAVDITGGGGKVSVAPRRIIAEDEERYTIVNYEGKVFKMKKP